MESFNNKTNKLERTGPNRRPPPPPNNTYLQEEVQDGRLLARGAWCLHGDALPQTLGLLLLEEHLGDVLPQPLVGYVHAELECTTRQGAQ